MDYIMCKKCKKVKKLTAKQVKDYRHECVDIYKITKGCAECGYNYHPSNLCFDHLPGEEKSEHVKNGYSKRSSAGGMYRLYSKKHSAKELISEIKKCKILCHNCHMKRTHYKNQRTIDKVEKRIYSESELEKLLIDFEST